MKTKRWLCALLCVLLCIGLLPVTALAAGGDAVYVGGVALTGSTDSPAYATTDDSGNVSTDGATAENYDIKWDGSTLTLDGAKIKGGTSSESLYATVGIYAFSNSGDVSLNIALKGVNEIFESSDGIWVYSSSYNAGAVTLTIEGEGSLNASGSSSGILVQSNNGNATLTIQNAEVTATSTVGVGVQVRSGAQKSASLTVDGGSLTATGMSEYGAGIRYTFGSSSFGSGKPSLTVSGNTIVRANGSAGGITSNSSTGVQYGTGGNSTGGIVWNGSNGTVYGAVTLQEDLTIGEGESLTLAENASLNANGCSVIVDGGTVDESLKSALGDSVKYPPTIATENLPGGTVGTAYSQTLAADGSAPIAWSVASGALPEGLGLNESTGEISGTPTAEGKSTFTVEATNNYGSEKRELAIEIKAAPTGSVSVSVTPDAIRLPSVTEGYEPQEPKYITIKNTGDQTIQFKEHGKDPWLIITLDKTTLKPDEEATVTVGLKDGLSAETRSTLKTFLSYTGQDGTKGQAHFKITYEVKHDMERVDAKEPTHLEDGNIECWYCAYCQKYYKGAAGANELSLEEIIIPKLKDHTADGTGWHSDETNHWNTCACGEKLNTAAHTFAWITDKEATATENGSKHEECTVCGYAMQAVEIPATGTATPAPTTTPAPTATTAPTATPAPTAEPGLGPKTGDPGVSALWFAAPAVSGLGLAAVCRRRRRGTR